jgi:intracellular sulfur oxidation DsrE/DsrF family protein
MSEESGVPSPRRSFLNRLNAGAAGLAAFAIGAKAQVKPVALARWEPARDAKDDWLDQPQSKHRMVFDTITPEGLGLALLFGANFLSVNRADYGLQNSDMAVVIVVRHRSVAFGYDDSIWNRYGVVMAAQNTYEDPKTKAAPKINLYNSADMGNLLTNGGVTIESLAKQGVQVAVCSVATRRVAGQIARAAGASADMIFNELTANLVKNARMVPSGITTLNRAQERGYSLATT